MHSDYKMRVLVCSIFYEGGLKYTDEFLETENGVLKFWETAKRGSLGGSIRSDFNIESAPPRQVSLYLCFTHSKETLDIM